jgi:hypothetical protein
VTIAPTGKFVSFVGVAFNGTNYLVSFSSDDGGADVMTRLVSPSGALLSGIVKLTSVPNANEVAVGVITSGPNFLVSYIDSLGTAGKGSVRARFVNPSGAAVGAAIPIAVPRNGKVVIGLLAPFSGGKYFATLLRGVQDPNDPGDTGLWTQKEVLGVLLIIPPPP